MTQLTDDQFERVLAALLADSADHDDEDNEAVIRDAYALWRPHWLPAASNAANDNDAAADEDPDEDGGGWDDPAFAPPERRR